MQESSLFNLDGLFLLLLHHIPPQLVLIILTPKPQLLLPDVSQQENGHWHEQEEPPLVEFEDFGGHCWGLSCLEVGASPVERREEDC
jgi:hypothetical protein